MPKKLTNGNIVEEYLDHIKKEKKLSPQTLKTYDNIGNNLPFNILTSQTTILKKLKDTYDNPNTLALYLNMIILIRKYKSEEIEKLIKFRNTLSESIKKERKTNLDILDDTLPTYTKIKEELDNLSGVQYIINYLMLNHGLRNKDLNLKFVKSIPTESDENLIKIKGKTVLLNINSYKTAKIHGEKDIKVSDLKFLEELKKIKLNDNDYLVPMKNGDKINNITTFNDKMKKLTIGNLGQNRLVKIVIKHLLNTKRFDKLEQIGKDRGTSMGVLLTSYNLQNGNDNNEK